MRRLPSSSSFVLLLALAAGCGGTQAANPTRDLTALALAPDFHLVDLSATSPRSGQTISPRDYLQRVSGWYFGHAS